MENLVFIKLGGSLITDKRQRFHARADTIRRLGREIARACATDPSLKIVIGHGSGSFGHVAARESGYDPNRGHASPWALVQVGAAASALNNLVRASLLEVGLPVLSLPPSASARLRDSEVVDMAVEPFADLLDLGVIPLTYGDVALNADGAGSGIASTEALFRLLAGRLQPRRLLLLGIVDGVLERMPTDEEPHPPLIREIDPDNWQAVRQGLSGSHGTDVTGGMISKVAETLALVQAVPGLEARIVNGEHEGLLDQLLLYPEMESGTLVHAGKRESGA